MPQVVLEKRPLNGCSVVVVHIIPKPHNSLPHLNPFFLPGGRGVKLYSNSNFLPGYPGCHGKEAVKWGVVVIVVSK